MVKPGKTIIFAAKFPTFGGLQIHRVQYRSSSNDGHDFITHDLGIPWWHPGPEPRLQSPAMARSRDDLPVPEAPSSSSESPADAMGDMDGE